MEKFLIMLTLFIGINVNAQTKEELVIKLDEYEKECLDYLQKIDKSRKLKDSLINNREKELIHISTFEKKYQDFINLNNKLKDINNQLLNHKSNKNISLSDLNIYKKQYLNKLSKIEKPDDRDFEKYLFLKKYFLSDSDFFIMLIDLSVKPIPSCADYHSIKKRISILETIENKEIIVEKATINTYFPENYIEIPQELFNIDVAYIKKLKIINTENNNSIVLKGHINPTYKKNSVISRNNYKKLFKNSKKNKIKIEILEL